ncbi:DUF2569 domain-containing protein [Paracoccus onubensis]|uniref:DUF2569 domain-containing protein n=1 Tax=Paracoccus onubensis TaxID=1675788 RepID=UPI002731DAAB|nr:DUF2569 domain-containing protein [Paracoccus onubensis]MDP0925640.1 DUF2569 domain-containing protein [Paracoccus onubensis]
MPPTYDPNGPSGIGGWLILPLLGLIAAAASTGFNLVQAFMQWDSIGAIIQGNEPSLLYLRLPVIASLAIGLLAFALALFCLYLMLTRSSRTPNWMIGYYLFGVVVAVVEYLATRAITPSEASTMIYSLSGAVIGLFIWIPYFRVSKRVANTFRQTDAEETRQIFT